MVSHWNCLPTVCYITSSLCSHVLEIQYIKCRQRTLWLHERKTHTKTSLAITHCRMPSITVFSESFGTVCLPQT
jgi:hypothetical protein